jgi:hypothetical protein
VVSNLAQSNILKFHLPLIRPINLKVL